MSKGSKNFFKIIEVLMLLNQGPPRVVVSKTCFYLLVMAACLGRVGGQLGRFQTALLVRPLRTMSIKVPLKIPLVVTM